MKTKNHDLALALDAGLLALLAGVELVAAALVIREMQSGTTAITRIEYADYPSVQGVCPPDMDQFWFWLQ